VAERKKRGCLGCSFPVLIIIIIIALAIVIIGFLAGGIGQNLLEKYNINIHLPTWLIAESPEPHLPAPVLFHVFGLPITNTMLAGWITVIFLAVASWLITRRIKLIPGKLQAAFEFILGWIFDFCKSVAGETYGRKFFPVICTIFLFVAFNAWLSLIPGFGSIKIGEHELIRGANTDINTPLAIALVSFVFVEYYGLRTLGVKYLRKFVNVGGFFSSVGNMFRGRVKKGLSGLFNGFIDIFVGGLETLSELIRIVSFTFRLFGNMTAGEILIMVAAFLIPMAIGWMVYGLELFIGFIQALVFSGLTLAFASMAVASHEEESH
jgi:F-type H+-transporting ATPase subunit a